jgi:hypothetical protein
MQLPLDIKKCVVFIGLQKADGEYIIGGTGFLVVDDTNKNQTPYIVTAKHVIEGIRNTGLDTVCLRVNLNSGTAKWYSTEMKDWKYHSDTNVDVAIFKSSGDATWDHRFYPLSFSVTQQHIEGSKIDSGDDIFLIGLFTQHHGQQKNIPIVRVGNISAMPIEKIQTKDHLMDGYLIEARSIGGLSGSPVFVNLGTTRMIDGQLKTNTNGIGHLLMGLIYGHYDQGKAFEKVNMGIGIVTPVEKVIETINEK